MKRSLLMACLALLFTVPQLMAQSSTSDQTTSLADRSPSENVNSGYVSERSPGRIVQAARARHMALRDARLSAQHAGDTSLLAPEESSTGSSTGSLLTSLLGGLSPSTIGSFLNSGSSTGASGSSGSSGGLSNLPPEVLQMLTSFGIDAKDLQNLKQKDEPVSEVDKTELRSQTTSGVTQERDFIVRWADAMASTIFTSAAVALQTTDFIDLLKGLFRPLFGIEQDDAADESATNMILPERFDHFAGRPARLLA